MASKFSGNKEITHIDLLLLGKTGHGKSATGNSIIGRTAFHSSPSTSSVTAEVQFEVRKYNKIIMKVVDTPGVEDTSCIEDKKLKKELIEKQMKDAVILNPEGYHAFLLVYKYGTRFTKEEHESVQQLKEIFGDSVIREYCILIITEGDEFRKTYPKKEIRDWLQDQKNYFHKLLKECGYRAVLFDNMTDDENIKNHQIEQLIDLVRLLKTDGKRYKDHHFEEAEQVRQKILSKEGMISQDHLNEISLILADVMTAISSNESFEMPEEITSRIGHLKKKLQRINTESTQAAILVSNIEKSVMSLFENKKSLNEELQRNKDKFDDELDQLSLLISEYTIVNDAYKQHMAKINDTLGKQNKKLETFISHHENEYDKKHKELSEKLNKKREELKKLVEGQEAKRESTLNAEQKHLQSSDKNLDQLSGEIVKLEKEIIQLDTTAQKTLRDKKLNLLFKQQRLRLQHRDEQKLTMQKKEEIERKLSQNFTFQSVLDEGKVLKLKETELTDKLKSELMIHFTDYEILKKSNTKKISKNFTCFVL